MIKTPTTLACLRSSYQVLKASGDDIRDYLQSQITQDISLLTPENPIYTAILTPQGKMIADMYIMDAGDELVMITGKHHALALVERLRRFSMGHAIRLGIVESLTMLSIQGDLNPTEITSMQAMVYASMPMSEAYSHGAWWVVEHQYAAQILAFFPHVCTDTEMEQARIIHGKPRFGMDWDTSIQPMNANLIEMRGVSFDKGCYVGQEVTSRMHWRGGVKKKLYHVSLSAMPEQTPCPIQSTVNIGTLRRAALDEKGKVWGIAHLPIEVVEQGSSLSLENTISIKILEACHA